VLFGLLLVPPSLSTKLWIIGIGFGRGGGHAGEDGYRHEGRNECLHDHSPAVGEGHECERTRNTEIVSSAVTKRDIGGVTWHARFIVDAVDQLEEAVAAGSRQ
jgi:hypothetical protein